MKLIGLCCKTACITVMLLLLGCSSDLETTQEAVNVVSNDESLIKNGHSDGCVDSYYVLKVGDVTIHYAYSKSQIYLKSF